MPSLSDDHPETQPCPICNQPRSYSERYPDALCEACVARATDADGRLLVFGNAGFFGGFIAQYADTREVYDSHACTVDGVRCWADEARFGGIVVQPETK